MNLLGITRTTQSQVFRDRVTAAVLRVALEIINENPLSMSERTRQANIAVLNPYVAGSDAQFVWGVAGQLDLKDQITTEGTTTATDAEIVELVRDIWVKLYS